MIPGRVLFTTQFGNDHYPTLSSTSEENTQGARIEVSLVNETIADLTGAGDHHDNHFHYPRHYEAQPPAYIRKCATKLLSNHGATIAPEIMHVDHSHTDALLHNAIDPYESINRKR